MNATTKTSVIVAIFTGALSSSCTTADDETTQPIAPMLDEMGEHLGEFRSGAEAHTAEILDAADLAAIAEIEAPHHHMTSGMLEDVEHELIEMEECHHDDGDSAETSGMAEAVEAGLGEMNDHASAMDLAGTLEDAIAEEGRHEGAMSAVIDELEAEHTKLEGATKGMMCPMEEGH